MDSEWQRQEAQNDFSRPIKRAAGGDVQVVTVHGKPTAVVVSAEEYAQRIRRGDKDSVRGEVAINEALVA